jgi:Spy/CpxP family protein refolding chaperone
MAARVYIMTALLAAGWVSQAWSAAAEPNRPRARLSSEDRTAMLRMAASDRWMPQDTVATLRRAIQQLNLTEEQTQKVTGILQAKEEALATARKAYADAGKALDEASSKGDDAVIRAAAVKVGNALADLQILRKKVAAEIRTVLTPDQLKKLEQIKDQPLRSLRPRGTNGSATTTGQAVQPAPGARPSQPQPDKK